MNEAATTPVAVFGDPTCGRWGLLIGGEQPRFALSGGRAMGEEATWTTGSLHRNETGWRLTAEGAELELTAAAASTSADVKASALRPCRMKGVARLAGARVELDAPGALLTDLPRDKVDSVRMVGSWFADGHELALLSVRPTGAKGHDHDQVDVIARGEEQPLVFDPRLSTTYGADGIPRKAGIELWLGENEDGEQTPRRVSGVGSGAQLGTSHAGIGFAAYALDCASRGETGPGVYLLVTPET